MEIVITHGYLLRLDQTVTDKLTCLKRLLYLTRFRLLWVAAKEYETGIIELLHQNMGQPTNVLLEKSRERQISQIMDTYVLDKLSSNYHNVDVLIKIYNRMIRLEMINSQEINDTIIACGALLDLAVGTKSVQEHVCTMEVDVDPMDSNVSNPQ